MPNKTDTKINLNRVILPPGRLLVREVPPETVSPGGIILPDTSRGKRTIATIIHMGTAPAPNTLRDVGIHEHLEVGDEIIVGQHAMDATAGEEFGKGVHATDESEILAIIKPEKPRRGKKR